MCNHVILIIIAVIIKLVFVVFVACGHCPSLLLAGDPILEGAGEEKRQEEVREEMVDLVIPMDGDSDGTSVVEELVYAGMKRKWPE